MSDQRDIDALLRDIEPLTAILEDLHVRHVTIAPTGEWTFEKLGRIRSGDETIGAEQLAELASAVSKSGLVESWSLRSFQGHAGPTILLERRPSAIVDRIPDEVLQALKKRARRDGVTVIAGPPGSGKSNVLLWATRHLADEQIILVSETPPAESPGTNVIHVTTPASEAGHRDLQRLMRRAPNVSWDRVSGLQDVNTFLGGASARRRVFTLDSSDTVATLRRFDAWRALGYEANLDVLLQLTSSVIGRAEVLDLLVFDDGEWHELYTSTGSRLEEVRALGRTGQRKHAITRPGIEPDRPTGPGAPTPEDSEPRVEALRAGIRKRPGFPTQDFEGPSTIPVPEASEVSESSTNPVGNDQEDEAPAEPDDAPSITSRIEGEPSTEMLEQLGDFDEEDPTQSGEIDLQGFIARKEQEDSGGMIPEETQQYKVEIDDPDLAVKRHEAPQPDEIIPGVDLNAEPTGSYNLENLKITRVEEVEEAEMEHLRALREESLADASSDVDTHTDEDAFHPSVEIDEDDLIYEDDLEWDEDESARTAIASSDAYEAAAKEITGRIEDPPEDASELLDDAEEDTAEFSIGDKIRIIRQRLKGEEG